MQVRILSLQHSKSMKPIEITRSQAEMLVDVLETSLTDEPQDECDELAAEVRRCFGMNTKEQSKEAVLKYGLKEHGRSGWLLRFAKVLAHHHEQDCDELGVIARKVLEWLPHVPETESDDLPIKGDGRCGLIFYENR